MAKHKAATGLGGILLITARKTDRFHALLNFKHLVLEEHWNMTLGMASSGFSLVRCLSPNRVSGSAFFDM